MCVLIFKSFHRPHWKIADVLAPDSRLHNFERSGQLQNVRAAETLKFPIAPMGKLLTRLHRLSLAQLRMLRSTTGGVCRSDLENFPSPQWETHVLLVACRAVVSQSLEAQ